MGANVHPVARWSLVGALGLAVLMVVYYLTGGDGTIAFGFAVIGLATAAFIYLFYARMNTVQRSGNMALLFVILIALLLPFFFLAQAKQSKVAAASQYDAQLRYAAGKYATYCASCHGLLGQGLSGPRLNGNKDLQKVNINSVITSGILNSGNPALNEYLMPAWSEQYGGPFNQDDINALTAFVASQDPVLRAKNNVPSDVNGFTYVFGQLSDKDKATYKVQEQQANAPADAAIDLTAQKEVTIPIIADPKQTGGASWNFLYPVPNGAATRTIKVKAGTVIKWQNTSGVPHSVFSGAPGNNSGPISINIVNNGATTEGVAMPAVTKETTIPYYCSFHPAMVAQIIVEP